MAGAAASNSKTANMALIVPMNPQWFRATANRARVCRRFLKKN